MEKNHAGLAGSRYRWGKIGPVCMGAIKIDEPAFCVSFDRLGFGLNVAPSVMKYVLTAVLTQDETVDRATSSYLDDILVNEDVVSVQCAENHLLRYGFECKPAERVVKELVLALEVWGSEERYVGSATTHSARFWTR